MGGALLRKAVRATAPEVLLTSGDPRVEPEPNTGCWLWTGRISVKGYGRVGSGRRGRNLAAHRAVWEKLRGPSPAGLFLDHKCRVRSCVNPDHLRVVTHAQNNTENSLSPTALHKAKTRCPKCNGEFVAKSRPVRAQGVQRVCRTCANAWESRRRAKQRANARLVERAGP